MNKFNPIDLLSEKANIKYPCTKLAIVISKENPAGLYQHFDLFLKLLGGENKILKWTAIQVIGNLSRADVNNKIEKIIPLFINYIGEGVLITACNSIKALTEIALNKPEQKETILNELLKIEKAKFYNKSKISPECSNVAIGQVINSLSYFGIPMCGKKEVIAFLKRQTKNTRPGVRKNAEKLLMKIKPLKNKN